MTGVPLLGEFLGAAHRQLDGARGWAGTSAPGRDIDEVTGSLRRFVTVAVRYTRDVIAAFDEMSDRDQRAHKAWPKAAAVVLEALAGTMAVLEPGDPAGWPPRWPAACGLARRLDAATASLTVGRDLLQTHFAQRQQGRVRRSGWAPVIASPAVSQALLADIASLTGQAASLAARVSAVPGRSATPGPAAERLRESSQRLARAGVIAQAAFQLEPVTAADRELLHAIPASALPARRVPEGRPSVADLCAAITITAGRARQAAWIAARLGGSSLAISVTSWRGIAASGAAVSNSSHGLLAMLAAGHGDPEVSASLETAAQRALLARDAWRVSARRLDTVATDVRGRVSRAAAEGAELARLTGNLADASSGQSLPGSHGTLAHPAGALAPDDTVRILDAVHHACDGIAWLADASRAQARAAVGAQRILVPIRLLGPGLDRTEAFVPASGDQTRLLLRTCSGARSASARTARSVGEIAVAVQAPSRVVAAARAATGSRRHRGTEHGQAEALAAESGAAGAGDASSASRRPDPGGGQGMSGPFESRLRAVGVTSPRFLRRAATLDKGGQRIVAEAVGESLDSHAPMGRPAGLPDADAAASRLPAPGKRRSTSRAQSTPHNESEFEAET